MYAEELLVHEGCQRQAVERLHACIINLLGVLDFACGRRRKDQVDIWAKKTQGGRGRESNCKS